MDICPGDRRLRKPESKGLLVRILGIRRSEGDRGSAAGKMGFLKVLWKDLRLAAGLARDLANGSYRQVPVRAMAALALALAYVVSPLDLMTDLIPVVGWLDDGVVVLLCLKLAETDLKRYQRWKQNVADR